LKTICEIIIFDLNAIVYETYCRITTEIDKKQNIMFSQLFVGYPTQGQKWIDFPLHEIIKEINAAK
jgi:hypothetical protein